MTIEEMKARKTELGYTNEQISELSGVPLGTVQKIFAGETKSPRYNTIQKLVGLLEGNKEAAEYEPILMENVSNVSETSLAHDYSYYSIKDKRNAPSKYDHLLKPPKKIIGIANGKYKIPPDELFFDDEIAEMFEDI